ncbi:MAG: Tim44 domain-containing protein [Burkholderiales bacterium]
MKFFSLVALVMTLGFSVAVGDAEAAKQRVGGGKSTGMQRQMNTPDKSPAAASTAAPAAGATAPNAGAAAAAKPRSSWMGPLAGLAAGLGLAALASHLGFGEELASMLMIGLLVMAVIVAIGFFMRRRAGAGQPALAGMGAGSGGANYKYGASDTPQSAPMMRAHDVSLPGSAASSPAVAVGNIPAEFDVAAFERNAKINFIRLQAANDAGNLEDIREFSTPEMFAELKMNITERGAATQHTDVVSLNAQVLDVAEEPSRYVVSVRFTGIISEGRDVPSEPVDEIWHLVKPRQGNSGWLLAGIQMSGN